MGKATVWGRRSDDVRQRRLCAAALAAGVAGGAGGACSGTVLPWHRADVLLLLSLLGQCGFWCVNECWLKEDGLFGSKHAARIHTVTRGRLRSAAAMVRARALWLFISQQKATKANNFAALSPKSTRGRFSNAPTLRCNPQRRRETCCASPRVCHGRWRRAAPLRKKFGGWPFAAFAPLLYILLVWRVSIAIDPTSWRGSLCEWLRRVMII